jgi:hypothetical protein
VGVEGERLAKDGSKVYLREGRFWNVFDDRGVYFGQAVMLPHALTDATPHVRD